MDQNNIHPEEYGQEQEAEQMMYVYSTASRLNTMTPEEVEMVVEQLDTDAKGLMYQLLTSEISD